LGQRRGLKNPWARAREEDVFLVHPQNDLKLHPELVHWWLLVHSSAMKVEIYYIL
jgi:hypothetical protein